jgi:hypothetical protein
MSGYATPQDVLPLMRALFGAPPSDWHGASVVELDNACRFQKIIQKQSRAAQKPQVDAGGLSAEFSLVSAYERSVYLSDFDVNEPADLASEWDRKNEIYFMLRLFVYGAIADRVVLQLSTPLKFCRLVDGLEVFREAFERNEHHEVKPLFRMNKDPKSDSMTDYLKGRMWFNRSDPANPERRAYEISTATDIARRLDLANFPLTSMGFSVASELSSAVRRQIGLMNLSKDAMGRLNDLLTPSGYQTYRLTNAAEQINGHGSERLKSFVKTGLRDLYHKANALGDKSMQDDHFLWQWSNVSTFAKAAGLFDMFRGVLAAGEPAALCATLFKLRALPHFSVLRSTYLHNQTPAEMRKYLCRLSKVAPETPVAVNLDSLRFRADKLMPLLRT